MNGMRVLIVKVIRKDEAFPGKPYQFRIDRTQNYTPGRRCDQVWSMYHLAFGKYSGSLQHATNTLGFVPHAFHPPPSSLPKRS